MKKTPKPSDEELQIFYEAIKGTKPLVKPKTKIRLTPPTPKRCIRPVTEAYEEHFNFLNKENEDPVKGDTTLSYKQDSISNKILRKLHKGQYNVSAILDLHGKTVEKARLALDEFLFHCMQSHKRMVLIIHGKGNPDKAPKLKNQLNSWLRQTKLVLAFCSASPKDGGHGAVYVLLKSTRS